MRVLLGVGILSALATRSRGNPIQNALVASHGSKAAVASESMICSQIGIDLIKAGGNAADAMVGAELCVGVIGMYHSGIGGGGFMLVRDGKGNYETIDFRESAPAAAFQDMYKDDIDASVRGGLSVGVPGELRGLEYLHTMYGVLPWSTVVGPAVRVARHGFPVGEDLVKFMNVPMANGHDFLVKDPIWAEDFAPHGKLLKLGDTITRKRYANTLEKVAKLGADEFYEGSMAQSMVDLVQQKNGTMTLDDLKGYHVEARDAISIDVRGHRLFSTGAPSSGAICLSMLKTMEQYALKDAKDVNLTTHRFAEAMRFAYAARTQIGDPDFVGNMALYENMILSDRKAKEIRNKILDNQTQPVDAYGSESTYSVENHGTSHIVTTDDSGMAVSSTTTINLIFGAQIMTPDTGIIMNDEMNDFSIPNVRNEFGFVPSAANYIRPGKRPMSSITPVIAEHLSNNTLAFVTGAAGGSRIISATAQVAWHLLEHGMNMSAAIATPRLHDQLVPNNAFFEWAFDNATVEAMVKKGHNVTWFAPVFSSAQGIRRLWNGTFEAVGETRQRDSGGISI